MEETEFYGLKIKVAPDVLIPRPETELLVEIILGNKDCHSERSEESPEVRSFVANAPQDDKARPRGNRPKGITAPPAASTILEIGTGSGCIAIALAKHLPETQIDATERNAAALTVARENIAAHGLSEQIALHEADLFPPDQQQYDLIVSNPPYIATAELETLQPEVRDWEPHSALDGGTDGLDIYRRIVEKLPDWLAPNGIFIGEIGSDQSETIQPFFEQARCFDSIEIKNDLAGLPRIVVAKRR